MDIKKEILICGQIDGSCVKTAVETLRACLGYNTGSGINHGDFTLDELYSNIGNYFPNHKIIAFMETKNKKWLKQKNVEYGGCKVYNNKAASLWMFSYSEGENNAHMVIGYPCAYGNMRLVSAFKILL
jgi:hypothetical protein